jgi:ABC-type nitrate/sulfonate/bicarbonate transport system substrate-binding protein
MKIHSIKHVKCLAIAAFLLAIVTIWTGCDKRALDPVSVRMKWIINGTTSEFFYGRETKIFKSQGFDLEIQPGGPGISGVQLVATGATTFAVTSAEEVIRARVNNLPVIAVASVFQRNAVLFLSAESSGITSPAHFKNKTVALVTGDNSELQFNALLEGAGLKREDVKVMPWTFALASAPSITKARQRPPTPRYGTNTTHFSTFPRPRHFRLPRKVRPPSIHCSAS